MKDQAIMEMLSDNGVIKSIKVEDLCKVEKEEDYVNFCKDFQKNWKKVLTK